MSKKVQHGQLNHPYTPYICSSRKPYSVDLKDGSCGLKDGSCGLGHTSSTIHQRLKNTVTPSNLSVLTHAIDIGPWEKTWGVSASCSFFVADRDWFSPSPLLAPSVLVSSTQTPSLDLGAVFSALFGHLGDLRISARSHTQRDLFRPPPSVPTAAVCSGTPPPEL